MTQYKRYRFNFMIKNERGLNRIVKFLVKQNIAHHHLRISKSWAVDSYTGEKIHEKPLHEIMFWHDCKSKSDTTLKIHKLITKKFPKLIQFGISEPQPKPRFKKK